MDIEQALRTLQGHGVALARYVYARGTHSAAIIQAAEEFRTSESEMKRWWRLGQALCGPAPKGQRKDRNEAVRLAEAAEMSIQALLIIDAGVRTLGGSQASLPTEQFRRELTEEGRGMTIDELRAHVRDRLRRLELPPRDRGGDYVRVSRQADCAGYVYLLARIQERRFAPFLKELEKKTKRRYDRDSQRSYDQVRAEAFLEMRGTGVPEEKLTTAVILTAEDLPVASSEAERFLLTDGTFISHREFAAMKLAPQGIAILYDPNTNEPINAWRTQRTANALQREVLDADQGLCAVPGCLKPAEQCQAHHLAAWRDGGNTNLGNLVKVCATHHAWIDRGPDGKNGTLVRGPDGRIGWRHPGAAEIRYNRNPATRHSGRALASKN